VPEFRVCGDLKEMAEAVEFLQKSHSWV